MGSGRGVVGMREGARDRCGLAPPRHLGGACSAVGFTPRVRLGVLTVAAAFGCQCEDACCGCQGCHACDDGGVGAGACQGGGPVDQYLVCLAGGGRRDEGQREVSVQVFLCFCHGDRGARGGRGVAVGNLDRDRVGTRDQAGEPVDAVSVGGGVFNCLCIRLLFERIDA